MYGCDQPRVAIPMRGQARSSGPSTPSWRGPRGRKRGGGRAQRRDVVRLQAQGAAEVIGIKRRSAAASGDGRLLLAAG